MDDYLLIGKHLSFLRISFGYSIYADWRIAIGGVVSYIWGFGFIVMVGAVLHGSQGMFNLVV